MFSVQVFSIYNIITITETIPSTHTAQNTTDNCTSGEVRLVDGVTEYEGRIDLCYSGAWGSVCPNLWNSNDAKVVCRQLGYNNIG